MNKGRVKSKDVANEIEVGYSADHPHIARLYESFDDLRYIYLVNEYCWGGDLLEKL